MSQRTTVGSGSEWLDGAGYDAYVGAWSRVVASRFVDWLDVPAQAHWLDVGCGTGALSGVVVSVARPSRVVGVDPAADYVALAQSDTDDARASFFVADGMQLPFDDASFDVAISGLVLNFVPDATSAVAEQVRIRASEEPVWKGPSHDLLVALDELTRGRIREAYRQRLPAAADGRIKLKARAWAIRGATPPLSHWLHGSVGALTV